MERIKEPFNILCDELPQDVVVDGKAYPIKTGFPDWIRFFSLHEEKISSEEKIILSVNLLYTDKRPANIFAAYQALQSFAACKDVPKNSGTGKKAGAGKAPVFSYLYDSMYIFGDFRRYYGIDLRKEKDMHWYTFFALLAALPDESETKQRIAYRSVNPSEIKSREQKQKIHRIQDAIRIPHENITAEEIGAIFW